MQVTQCSCGTPPVVTLVAEDIRASLSWHWIDRKVRFPFLGPPNASGWVLANVKGITMERVQIIRLLIGPALLIPQDSQPRGFLWGDSERWERN